MPAALVRASNGGFHHIGMAPSARARFADEVGDHPMLRVSRASAQSRFLNARSEQQPSDPQEKLQHQRDRYADGQDYQREAEHDAHERQQVASY
jgi:hypothetical protein